MLDCQCNGTRSGPEIQRRGGIALQRQIDQQLGFRPRDQDRRIDRQVEAVELLAAQDVGDRLAAFSPLNEFEERIFDLEGNFLLWRRSEAGLRKTADLREQQPRLAHVDARRRNCL